MNFQDEDYRRLYIRRTVTNRRLGWEGRAVMHELLYEFDRSGVFEFGDDAAQDISDLVDLPLDVVQRGLTRLLNTRTWVMSPGRIVWSNFVEAQNCPRSDRLRQQELRERRRDEAMRGAPPSIPAPALPPASVPIAKTAELTSPVTPRAPLSRESRNVTPNRADPNLAEQRESTRALGDDFEPEQTDPALHIRIPVTWKVTEEFFAEAYAAGVTRSGLEEAVRYWRGRKLGGEWFSIEDFFRGKFASIKIREEKARFAAHQERNAQSSPRASPASFGSDLDTTGAALAFHASDDDRKFAARYALDLDRAVRDYRASPRARALDTPTQSRDFSNRLKCWHVTGQWIVDGALPKNPLPKRRATEAA